MVLRCLQALGSQRSEFPNLALIVLAVRRKPRCRQLSHHKHFKMAFTMKTVAPSTKLLSPRPLSIRARTSRATYGRSRLVIEAKTVWQLEAGGANKNKETVTLNDEINQEKSFVSVGDKAHSDAERVRAAGCILGQRMKHQQSEQFSIMHLGYF